MKASGPKFDDKILVKVPSAVSAALDQVARRRMQTRSELIRQGLLKILEDAGVTPLAA
jgi:metal-responsive CopG/Arc/MetJ family transcriptional regulator